MRKRLDQRFGQDTNKADKSTPAPALDPIDDKVEMEQVSAIYSLLQDRYREKYPLSKRFMWPASNPEHYANLISEIDAAPGRSWLGAWLHKWKGFLRFS
ncbi:MAG: hypothetical protein M1825_000637 [Sarcosagium campestre]|nr:MAG: hypothetical protein M1825_000637 [Sarcosagium campestre]